MPSARLLRAGWQVLRGVPLTAALLFSFAHAETTVEVSVANYRFDPPELRIAPGDTVRWINREKRTSHSVLFPAEGGRESERMFPDESWSRRFEQAGRYEYTCGPHPEMKGVVVVGP